MAKRDRREQSHNYYLENRERILAYQKEYRETHKAEIKKRRQAKAVEAKRKKMLTYSPISRAEHNHRYYMRHREEIIARSKRSYVRKQQQLYPTADTAGAVGDGTA